MKQVVKKSRAEANNVSNEQLIYTLLVDGNSLLKMSLVDKRMNQNGEEYGAVFVFGATTITNIVIKMIG